MNRPILFFFFFILLFYSCGERVESGKVVDIVYPSDKMEVPYNFYVLAVSISWEDTFVFNPLLFGQVKTIKPKGLKGSLYLDKKLIVNTKEAKHHFVKLSSNNGEHSITFKAQNLDKTISVVVKPPKIKFEREKKDFLQIENNIRSLILKHFKWSDKERFIRNDGFRLVQIVLNREKALLIWKKIYSYKSFFHFSFVSYKPSIDEKELDNEFILPPLYKDNQELFFYAGEGAVSSCGDSFLFRVLKDETVLLYRLDNNGSFSQKEISLYQYADKNDKLMTPTYKYPSFYHVSCAEGFEALAFPVYSDYNLDYKVVLFKDKDFVKSFRFIDYDNFKFRFFLSKRGSVLVQKIPEKIFFKEKHRLFYAREGIKEILIPLPFDTDYYPIDEAYVNIKGIYYPPKIKIDTLYLEKRYMSIQIFDKRGTFSIKEL
ncbi:MAG: hypothetical protein GXO22_07795 [Aquificae bacterium]|nr:hypothetical protein [Aquificota bacterium]